MNSSKLTFVAVPNPRRTGPTELRLSVVLSPRLTASDGADRSLSAFTDFPASWPDTLAQIAGNLRIKWDGGAAVPVTLAAPLRPVEARDRNLWAALFPPTRRVTPFVFEDHQLRPRVGFPATALAASVNATYQQFAVGSPTELPQVGTVLNDDGGHVRTPLDEVVRVTSRGRDMLDYAYTNDEIPAHSVHFPITSADYLHYFCQRFYQRRPVGTEPVYEEPAFDGDLEFHEIITLLADHPTLMRKLGLVFDVVTSAIPGPAASGTVEVLVPWKGPNATYPPNPRTRYTWDQTRFLPAPSAEGAKTIRNGCLRLGSDVSPPAFSVTSLDVDSAALKLAEFGMATRQLTTRPDQQPISRAALPSLRSSGLTLLQVDRDVAIGNAFASQARLDTPTGQVELCAEDLVRGIRLDVQDTATGQWRSLHQRYGEIDLAGTSVVIPATAGQDEEGYVSAATIAEGEREGYRPGTGKELYIHEAVAGWTGYSLSARPPGKSIVGSENGDDHVEGVEEVASENDRLGLFTEYKATPGSLPRLRFGKTYQLRARIADLAGGGLAPDGIIDGTAASPPVKYQRYEPVAAPTLLHRSPVTDGEQLETMVIRSDTGYTPTTYAALPTSVARGYQAVNQRHVVPPKSGLSVAEAHGLLDAAITSPQAATKMLRLVQRESATLLSRKYVSLESGAIGDCPGLELHESPGRGNGVLPLDALPAPGEPLEHGRYVAYTLDYAVVPYLPDPMARGVVFWDIAPRADALGNDTQTMDWPHGDDAEWAWIQSQRIELSASLDGVQHRDRAGNVLRIQLPPGHRMVLSYASTLVDARLDHMAIVGLISGATGFTSAQRATALQAVRDGKHWMVSPPRQLTLVHAVQRPVSGAAFAADAAVTREAFATTATLTGNLTCHGESTGHIDVRASWNEIVDSDDEDAPRLETQTANVERLLVPYGLATVPLRREATQPKRTIVTTGDGFRFMTNSAPHTVLPVAQEFNDTKARFVTYEPVASTRYLEHFPVQITKDRAKVETPGTPKRFLVNASAPPLPPRIAQILPTFKHTTSSGTKNRLTGLRIYLERPWCSSGVGEMLGVVFKRGGGDPIPEERAYVSMIGRDPVWNVAAANPMSSASLGPDTTQVMPIGSIGTIPRRLTYNFATLDSTPISPSNSGHPTVDIIAYVPSYNPERKLWYVDLDFVAQDAYFPFVSLALVRYQPNAIEGAHASPVVRADMVQLAPGRYASVTTSGNTVSLSVSGAHAASARPGANGLMRAVLEKRSAGSGDLGWSTVSGPTTLTASATSGMTTWSGSLSKPFSEVPFEYRVVLVESEVYDTDGPDLGERVTYLEVVSVFGGATS